VWFLAAVVVAVWLIPGRSQTQTPAAEVAVQAGRLIDGVSTSARQNVTVLVGGGKVISVQDGFQAPAGARSSTCAPQRSFRDSSTPTRTSPAKAQATPSFARRLNRRGRRGAVDRLREADARAGFTTIRNLGAEGGRTSRSSAPSRRASSRPRMWTAQDDISITGGHGDQGGLRPDLWVAPTWMDGIVDSADEARRRCATSTSTAPT
jgi:hypothetical protein